MADQETSSPYAADPLSTERQRGGKVDVGYIKSKKGILHITVLACLLLGFICAVSISSKSARLVDSCKTSGVKVTVMGAKVAYLFFSFAGILVFALLLVVFVVNLGPIDKVKELLNNMMVIAVVGVFVVIMFILSAIEAAAEQRIRRCATGIRPGGPGAAAFFGFASVIAMVGFAALTLMDG